MLVEVAYLKWPQDGSKQPRTVLNIYLVRMACVGFFLSPSVYRTEQTALFPVLFHYSRLLLSLLPVYISHLIYHTCETHTNTQEQDSLH